MKILTILITAVCLGLSATAAHAASSGWMTNSQTNTFIRANLSKGKGKYPTAISCKQDGSNAVFKFTYKSIPDPKPFHKWNWVHGKASKLSSLVAKLKRSDKRHLKYRLVNSSTYKQPDGTKMGCGLAYR